MPSRRAHHSFRVLVLNSAASRRLVSGQRARSNWFSASPGPGSGRRRRRWRGDPADSGVAAPGVAAPADSAPAAPAEANPVRRTSSAQNFGSSAPTARWPPSAVLVHLVEPGAGVEQVGAPLVAPPSRRPEAVDHGRQQRRAIHHGGVDDLPLAGAASLQQRADHPEGQQQPAAPEIRHQVERRQRGLAPAADGRQRPRQGQVVDVMPGKVGVGPILAPARHPGVHQAGIALQAYRRVRSRAARPPRAGTPPPGRRRPPPASGGWPRRRDVSGPPQSSAGPGSAGSMGGVGRRTAGSTDVGAHGRSTRMTSAPMSASIMAPNGAGPSPANSTTPVPATRGSGHQAVPGTPGRGGGRLIPEDGPRRPSDAPTMPCGRSGRSGHRASRRAGNPTHWSTPGRTATPPRGWRSCARRCAIRRRRRASGPPDTSNT